MLAYTVKSAEETESLGAQAARMIIESGIFPSFVALYGDLGAGKTAFARGYASIISPGSRVKSPTYTIVNEYRRGTVPMFHFDFYRINSLEELDGIGFEEYLAEGHCIAEWCEKLGENLPDCAMTVKIDKKNENERIITIIDRQDMINSAEAE